VLSSFVEPDKLHQELPEVGKLSGSFSYRGSETEGAGIRVKPVTIGKLTLPGALLFYYSNVDALQLLVEPCARLVAIIIFEIKLRSERRGIRQQLD
jgi:hypothetical protein